MSSSNPRYANYSARQRMRKRIKAEGRPCAICGKPIDYSLDWWIDPRDGKRKRHPMSYELDEIVPVSRYMDGGYSSKGECATDYDNLQPAHRTCNQRKGNGNVLTPVSKRDKRRYANGDEIPKPLPTSRAW